MKAKDYIPIFKDCLAGKTPCYSNQPSDAKIGILDACIGVSAYLMRDMGRLAVSRNANTLSAQTAIAREIDQKWQAIVRLLIENKLVMPEKETDFPNIFRLVVKEEIPALAVAMGWA